MNRSPLLATGAIFLSALSAAGCAPTPATPTNPPAPVALSLEEWKNLPVPEKYDEASFERLRLANPQLKSDRAWRAFMLKEVMPERNKDIPPTTPQHGSPR